MDLPGEENIMSQSAPSHSPIEEVAEFFGRGPSREEIRQFQLSDEIQEWISHSRQGR